jgi:hypothetical protein
MEKDKLQREDNGLENNSYIWHTNYKLRVRIYEFTPVRICEERKGLKTTLWRVRNRIRLTVYPQMEFFEINFTKDSSLLPHAIHSPFYWRILKKTILYSGFNNPCKNPRTRKFESI